MEASELDALAVQSGVAYRLGGELRTGFIETSNIRDNLLGFAELVEAAAMEKAVKIVPMSSSELNVLANEHGFARGQAPLMNMMRAVEARCGLTGGRPYAGARPSDPWPRPMTDDDTGLAQTLAGPVDDWEREAMRLAFDLARNYGVLSETTDMYTGKLLAHLKTRRAAAKKEA